MLNGKKVLLGVSGGIAAYKAIALTSKLTQAGANVKVVMTKSATEFVTPLSFQAISRNEVYIDTFDEKDPNKIAHIDLADWPDFILLAPPATANLIGRIANGLADDMLTTIMLATEAPPVYIAPAMNVHMYQHPAVKRNMQTLDNWGGYHFIEPGEGYLACGYVGKGRLEEPEQIVRLLEQQFQSRQHLTGKKILISAGPTREAIDPVRFFTNHSSGKMGYALAEEASKEGAQVYLVSGPTSLETPKHVNRFDVVTAEEMFQQMNRLYGGEMDIVISAAAVADYRPVEFHQQKLKKQPNNLSIELERTRDILEYLGGQKQDQYLVGFAAESQHLIEYGKEKITKKNLDAIVINDISRIDIGFQSDQNEVTFLTKDGKESHINQNSKNEIARQILLFIDQELGKD